MKFWLFFAIAVCFGVGLAIGAEEYPEWFVLGNHLEEDVSSNDEDEQRYIITNSRVDNFSVAEEPRFANNNKDIELALKWLKLEYDTNHTHNILLSPLGFYLSSVLLANGVVDESLFEFSKIFSVMRLTEVNKQIKTYLARKDDNVVINLSLWGKIFSGHYRELMKSQLKAEIWGVGNTTEIINDWVKASTNSEIEDIAPVNATKDSDLFLANAVHFKGQWQDPFSAEKVDQGIFHNLNGRINKIDMLHNDLETDYYEDELMQSVRLFYTSGDYISIFLPKEDGFEKLLEKLDVLMVKPDYKKVKVRITLPKFNIKYNAGAVKDFYKNLGIRKIFEANNYDFAKMVSFDTPSFITDVYLTAKIAVDVQESVNTDKSATEYRDRDVVSFIADRPFIFMLNNGDFIGAFIKGDDN